MHKILNLARMHSDYVSQASSLYSEIVNLSSSSMYASNLYLLFLSSVVQDHKESEKVREKLSIIMEKILKER